MLILVSGILERCIDKGNRLTGCSITSFCTYLMQNQTHLICHSKVSPLKIRHNSRQAHTSLPRLERRSFLHQCPLRYLRYQAIVDMGRIWPVSLDGKSTQVSSQHRTKSFEYAESGIHGARQVSGRIVVRLSGTADGTQPRLRP